MFIYFFAGIQMSPAKIEQMMTGMVCQRGRAEFVSEIGCGPKKLVGARKKRWGERTQPTFRCSIELYGCSARDNIEQGIPPTRAEKQYFMWISPVFKG
jgi:hypothetical protein